jgi:hypothetical protein
VSFGFQLQHKAICRGGRCLTRLSHHARVRQGGSPSGVTSVRCTAVFTFLPHFVLRDRQMRPEVDRDALWATHGGLSLELCAVVYIFPPWRCVAPSANSPTRVWSRC